MLLAKIMSTKDLFFNTVLSVKVRKPDPLMIDLARSL